MSGFGPQQFARAARAGARVLPVAACALVVSLAGQAQDGAALRGPLAGDDVYGAYLGEAIPTSETGPDEADALPVDPRPAAEDPAAPAVIELAPAEGSEPQRLPDVDESATGTMRVQPADRQADVGQERRAGRVEAIEELDRAAEATPFEPLGFRVGSFILKPTLEQGVSVTSNADSSSDGQSAAISETALRLNAASDWTSHSALVDAYGIFRKTISGDEIEAAEGGLSAIVELEFGKDYRAIGALGFALAPESAASPTAVPDAESQALRQTITASLGLEKDAGKARFGITGNVEDSRYDDAELEGGGVLSQGDRDAALYTLELRAGYEISPALAPFVAAEVGRRIYEVERDSAGYARSADRFGLRAGLELDLGEKLSGEFSGGWVSEDFDDTRLGSISGLSVDGNLAWSPVRGTVVGLAGSTTVEGTTAAGESGSILYSGTLSLAREMRANLTGVAALGASFRDYAGSGDNDLILSAETGLTWWLNRQAGLTGRLRHEALTSSIPDREAKTSSVFVGVKLQR